MRLIAALLLSLTLVSSVSLADVPPPPTAAERRSQVFKEWWLWTLVAVLSAGTVVTSVVVATVPLHTSPETMALTVRF
jgi:hypothetical protein